MSERRRGLGRGLGALIPTSGDRDRPVDVFFPAAPSESAAREASDATDTAGRDGGVTTLVRPSDVPDEAEREGPSGADADARAVDLSAPVRSETTTDLEAGTEGASDTGAEGDSTASSGSGTDAASGGVGVKGGATDIPLAAATAGTSLDEKSSDASTDDVAPGSDRAITRTVEVGAVEADSPGPVATVGDEAPAVSRETGTPDAGGVELVPVPGASFAELPVGAIHPNARQPRTVFDESELDELIGSIREIGVLQPVVVRRDPDVPGTFELIMGERRWRATQAAGLTQIPAIIRDTDDSDMLRDALLENLHRSALNPLEEAAAYRQLLDDFGCTHEELASRISRSRPQISNTLRLLRLPPLVQRRVAAGVLSAGHARALLGLSDGAAIERLAQRIVAEGLSVRATEEIVSLGGLDEKRQARTPRAGQRIAAIDELSTRLSDRFDTRVTVNLGKNKGRLTVEFASVEDLNRILDKMAPEDPGLLRAQAMGSVES